MFFLYFGSRPEGKAPSRRISGTFGHILKTDANRLDFNPLAKQAGVLCPKTMQSYKISANYASFFNEI